MINKLDIIIKQFPNFATDDDAMVVDSNDADDLKYNCIMHVIGGKKPNIWPIEDRPLAVNDKNMYVFWPTDIPPDDSLSTFVRFFKKFKYEICDDESYDPSVRKIAIYCKPGTDIVTHAALMRAPSKRDNNIIMWSSKMGNGPLLIHRLHSLDGGAYGNIRCFMSRPKTITKEYDFSVIGRYIR